MFVVVRGKSVYLRRFGLDDVDLVLAGANEPQSARLTGTHQVFDRAQVLQYVSGNIVPTQDRAAFIIADTTQDRAVGEVVINEVDRANRSANVRIAIFDPSDWNKGYGSESLQLMVGYGFAALGLHRIELGVYEFNPRAVHVYEKAGFTREGVRRHALLWEGEYHDMIVMSVLEHEWWAPAGPA